MLHRNSLVYYRCPSARGFWRLLSGLLGVAIDNDYLRSGLGNFLRVRRRYSDFPDVKQHRRRRRVLAPYHSEVVAHAFPLLAVHPINTGVFEHGLVQSRNQVSPQSRHNTRTFKTEKFRGDVPESGCRRRSDTTRLLEGGFPPSKGIRCRASYRPCTAFSERAAEARLPVHPPGMSAETQSRL